jgi:hypothetical protein
VAASRPLHAIYQAEQDSTRAASDAAAEAGGVRKQVKGGP